MTAAALAVSETSDGGRVLALSGRLDSASVTGLWDSVRRAVADAPARRVVVDAGGVDYCDGAGIALFVDLLRHPRDPQVEIANLKPAFQVLLGQFDPGVLERDLDPEPPRGPAIEEIGRAATYGATSARSHFRR
jgi:phospholipid/cholesterol/gamma-HCH transport system permease protein